MKFTLLLISLTVTLNSFTQLSAGDILFVGWYGDNGDGLAFVTMNTIPDGTQIYFNDNEWNGLPVGAGGAFSDLNEGAVLWTNNLGGAVPAGVVITIAGTDTIGNQRSSCGAVTLPPGTGNGCLRINASNEVVYAYTGTSVASPTTFLAAITNDGWASGSITNTGLIDGTTAFDFSSVDADGDVAVYIPGNYSVSSIMNTSNWAAQDGSNDQGQDGIYPDFPDDLPPGTEPCGILSSLPIELLFVDIEKTSNGVAVEWETATEINNDRFEIYRSIDGVEMELMGTVNGSGNSSEIRSYSFVDFSPYSGISYYRLKQIDFDGAFSWSDFYSVDCSDVPLKIKAFPNPIKNNQVCIQFNQKIDQYSIDVRDVLGRSVPFHLQSSDFDICLLELQISGVFYIQLFFKGKIYTLKLIGD
ncbi:MAG: T9SS type A sorting domain-containing protein [Crocinitomicaceae bacterium]